MSSKLLIPIILRAIGDLLFVCCPCGKDDDDFMIGCDTKECRFQWYHYECVGLDGETIPEGDWFCGECLSK